MLLQDRTLFTKIRHLEFVCGPIHRSTPGFFREVEKVRRLATHVQSIVISPGVHAANIHRSIGMWLPPGPTADDVHFGGYMIRNADKLLSDAMYQVYLWNLWGKRARDFFWACFESNVEAILTVPLCGSSVGIPIV